MQALFVWGQWNEIWIVELYYTSAYKSFSLLFEYNTLDIRIQRLMYFYSIFNLSEAKRLIESHSVEHKKIISNYNLLLWKTLISVKHSLTQFFVMLLLSLISRKVSYCNYPKIEIEFFFADLHVLKVPEYFGIP